MKVRELIAQLQALDPERNIWIVYDSFLAYEPDFKPADEDTMNCNPEIEPGDYADCVG